MSKHTLTIVIPMAGEGSRFAKAGFKDPKPFIDVQGKPMIERVMENVYINGARFILIARREHLNHYEHVITELRSRYDVDLVLLDKLTEGTACTVLAAFKFINNEVPLLIANSDQIVDTPMQDFVQDCLQKQAQGSILCFRDEERNPKWSFARINSEGFVEEVKEKVAISDLATVGIYLFSSGRSFCEAAIEMIVQNERVNNEFYTCPVYNYLIQDGQHIVTYTIPESAMHGIGTPEDLNVYLQRLG